MRRKKKKKKMGNASSEKLKCDELRQKSPHEIMLIQLNPEVEKVTEKKKGFNNSPFAREKKKVTRL